jgi:acetylornithine/succinyldiaminopimelate/putrescine aminotransferase
VIRLLPPLVINQQEAQLLVDKLVPVVNKFLEAKSL